MRLGSGAFCVGYNASLVKVGRTVPAFGGATSYNLCLYGAQACTFPGHPPCCLEPHSHAHTHTMNTQDSYSHTSMHTHMPHSLHRLHTYIRSYKQTCKQYTYKHTRIYIPSPSQVRTNTTQQYTHTHSYRMMANTVCSAQATKGLQRHPR